MKLENINIDSFVNNLSVTTFYRNKVKKVNVLGDMLITGGKKKYKISFKINLVNSEQWMDIVNVLLKQSFNLTFEDPITHEALTKIFTVDETTSNRLIVAGSTTYYKDNPITMEEL